MTTTAGPLTTLSIPRQNSTPLNVQLQPGDVLFLMGANGTGKSGLLQHFNQHHQHQTLRIPSHRQIWFATGAVDITPKQSKERQSSLRSYDAQSDARYLARNSGQRPMIALYKLIEAENTSARDIAKAARSGDFDDVRALTAQESPIERINRILRLANMAISVSLNPDGEFLANHRKGYQYDIAQMSDGERNALLIASDVLTAPAGSLILVDEPELHLHRSIITPLLGALFSARTDCAYVISTHETHFPSEFPDAHVLLIRDSLFRNGQGQTWEVDMVESPETNGAWSTLSEDLRRDILGSRRQLIFVEGDDNSLDKKLFSLVLPSVSIVPKGGCIEVERAVNGLRSTPEQHWVDVYGIVDRDDRTQEERERLQGQGIYALQYRSIEAVYYHLHIQTLIAERQAKIHDTDASALTSASLRQAMRAVRQHQDHLVNRRINAKVRESVLRAVPKASELPSTDAVSIEVDISSLREKSSQALANALERNDFDYVIRKYPLRETGALGSISKELKFQHREDYENAVLKMLQEDEEALRFVKQIFQGLQEMIDNCGIDSLLS